jgi:hypothetical protein
MTFTEFCKKHGLHQARMESHGCMWARVAIEEMQAEIDTLRAAPVAQPATDDLPTPAMCRAAVIYANGPDIYKRIPAEVTEIEEGIYAEVWKAMQAAAPVVAQPDCRTCQNFSIRSGGCSSVFLCVDASMYKASPPVRYWKENP